MAELPENIYFLTHFFCIENRLGVSVSKKLIFSPKRLHISPSFPKNNTRFPSEAYLGPSRTSKVNLSAKTNSKNNETSKQSVVALKKPCSKNVSEGKHSHLEKPGINNTLEIGEKRERKHLIDYK